jgi:GT2 family glycosyltransferase
MLPVAELRHDQPTVIVVILNWNRCADTLACLASLGESTYHNFAVIVVDQGSQDGSEASIRRAYPAVTVLQTGANLGFGRGMNTGIRQALAAGAKYVFLLNNDTLAAPTLLERLLAHATPDLGMLAPSIFYADRPQVIWSTGGGVHPLLLEMTGDHGRGEPLPAEPRERAFLSGCALLIPRQTLGRAGLFDERFFMYYEDLDLCLRMQQEGYRLLLIPDAHLWHRVAQSSGGANSPNERYQMARSSGIYFRKHMHAANALPIIVYRSLSALRWTLRLAHPRDWPALRAYWRGLAAGWLDRPPPP